MNERDDVASALPPLQEREPIDVEMLLATAEDLEKAGEIYLPKHLRRLVDRVHELEAASASARLREVEAHLADIGGALLDAGVSVGDPSTYAEAVRAMTKQHDTELQQWARAASEALRDPERRKK